MLTSSKKLMALETTSVLPSITSSAGQGKPFIPNFLSFVDGDMEAKKSIAGLSSSSSDGPQEMVTIANNFVNSLGHLNRESTNGRPRTCVEAGWRMGQTEPEVDLATARQLLGSQLVRAAAISPAAPMIN